MTNRIFAGGLLLATALHSVSAAEDLAQWASKRSLHLNTAADGAAVAADVAGFPLLVRLNKHVFPFAEAQGKGGDIRFAKPDGTLLPHQIERWDSAAGRAEVWVRVDTVKGNSTTQEIQLHWGKADAPDASDGKAVFDTADGWVGVWHMGGDATGQKPNSVAGGNAAVPGGYEGDEGRIGPIGPCDSLDGAGTKQDHLDLGDGYADFSGGFTYSVWAAPAAASFWSRLLDLGNGEGADNIILRRRVTSNDLEFEHFAGTVSGGTFKAVGALSTGEWQHIAVTVAGRQIRLYRNGSLAASGELAAPLSVANRTANWIGKSNWGGDNYYKGFLDEPRLARRAEDPSRIKLAFANQKAGQRVVSFSLPGTCAPVFEVPRDTVLGEAHVLDLAATAECASSYAWSLVAGPAAPVLDPNVTDLRVILPRVTADTLLRYRFEAAFGDSTRSAEVTIRVKEEIPDPVFTLPAPAWGGAVPLEIRPSISNWGSVKASRAPDFRYAWTLEGVAVDTAWKNGGLLLEKSDASGELTLGLCLDNGGAASCKTTVIRVGAATSLVPTVLKPGFVIKSPAYDAAGRRRPAESPGPVGAKPLESTPEYHRAPKP